MCIALTSIENAVAIAKTQYMDTGAWAIRCLHVPADIAIPAINQMRQIYPRFRIDYSLATLTWLIYSCPPQYHEVAPRMLRNIDRALEPVLVAALGQQYDNIDWNSGQGDVTIRDASGRELGIRQPDASVGMEGREYPTIVWETGFTQPYSQLQIAARTYLLGNTMEGVLHTGQGLAPQPRIELVILVIYNGKRPSQTTADLPNTKQSLRIGNAAYMTYDIDEYLDNTPGVLKPCTVRVDFWRLRPTTNDSASGGTCSNKKGKLAPTKFQSAIVSPAAMITPGQTLTIYASDIIGSENIPLGSPPADLSLEIPLVNFTRAVEMAHSRTVA